MSRRKKRSNWAAPILRSFLTGVLGRLSICVNLSDVAAGGAEPRPSSEGRCIPRFQVYRLSAQRNRLLVWRSIRCDAPGLNVRSNAGSKNVTRSFHAPGSRSHRKFSGQAVHAFGSALRKDLFSVQGRNLSNAAPLRQGWCALTAATLLKSGCVGGCRAKSVAAILSAVPQP
jgi:hypothetical protein